MRCVLRRINDCCIACRKCCGWRCKPTPNPVAMTAWLRNGAGAARGLSGNRQRLANALPARFA